MGRHHQHSSNHRRNPIVRREIPLTKPFRKGYAMPQLDRPQLRVYYRDESGLMKMLTLDVEIPVRSRNIKNVQLLIDDVLIMGQNIDVDEVMSAISDNEQYGTDTLIDHYPRMDASNE